MCSPCCQQPLRGLLWLVVSHTLQKPVQPLADPQDQASKAFGHKARPGCAKEGKSPQRKQSMPDLAMQQCHKHISAAGARDHGRQPGLPLKANSSRCQWQVNMPGLCRKEIYARPMYNICCLLGLLRSLQASRCLCCMTDNRQACPCHQHLRIPIRGTEL